MYQTSDGYKNAVLQYDKKYESKITIGSKVITNENLISFTTQQSMQQDETFSVGNTISSCLNLIFLHNDVDTDDKDIINLKLGLLVNGAYEYIPLGIYNIQSIDSNDTTTTLLCYDNMVKFDIAYSENNENPTLHTVINRLVQLTGVNFGGTLSNYKDYKLTPLKGYSCREVLGFIAGVLGSNAIINREGKFDFVSLSTQPIYAIERFELVTKDGSVVMTKDSEVVEVKAQVGYAKSDNYYDYTKKNKNYKIKKVINSTDIGEMSLGSIDDNSVCLSMRNPFVDEDILQDIYAKMNGLEFLPYSLNWSGDISIDLGDLMTVTDTKGVMRCHPVLSQTVTYNGALNTILGASGDTKLANTYVVKTEQEAELDRTQEDVKEVIDEVSGVKVEINKMQDSIELKAEKTEVEDVKEDVKNVKNDVSSININLNSITQRVSSTEETVSTINGEVTDLESRMDSAEQKITPDAIVSTVQSSKTDGKNTFVQQSDIKQLNDSWTATFNDGYNQGVTTINKDGITVTSSNVNSKTNMSANGFKITNTSTNEDVFKVNTDGTLAIKGNITVTGGSIPSGNLTGTISADRLDANTIVSKVNGATTTISGDKITTGTLSASKITTGTLDASKVSVTNLNASSITSGTISADRIDANTLKGKTITGGAISGGSISGATIAGGTLNIGSNFSVDASGNLIAKSANFTGSINSGSTITGATITGGTLNITNSFTMGSSSGTTTSYHTPSQSKWMHSDGSYTLADSKGLMRYSSTSSATSKSYHYLTATGTVEVGQDESGDYPTYIDVTLPEEFQNKWFTVTVSVAKCFTPSRMTISNRDKFSFLGFETSCSITNYQSGIFRIYGRGTYLDFSNSQYYGGDVVYSAVRVNYTVVA